MNFCVHSSCVHGTGVVAEVFYYYKSIPIVQSPKRHVLPPLNVDFFLTQVYNIGFQTPNLTPVNNLYTRGAFVAVTVLSQSSTYSINYSSPVVCLMGRLFTLCYAGNGI